MDSCELDCVFCRKINWCPTYNRPITDRRLFERRTSKSNTAFSGADNRSKERRQIELYSFESLKASDHTHLVN